MKSKFLRIIFASLVLALSISTQVSAQGEGRLLFFKGNGDGSWATGGIDMFGHYQLYGSGSSYALQDKTNLIATPSYMLAYSTTTGAVTTLLGVSQGVLGPVWTGYTFSPNWSIIG